VTGSAAPARDVFDDDFVPGFEDFDAGLLGAAAVGPCVLAALVGGFAPGSAASFGSEALPIDAVVTTASIAAQGRKAHNRAHRNIR